jgi:hypothetical protein
MELPVTPFHGHQGIRVPDGEALAGQLLRFAEEEIRVIQAVDGPVVRHLGTSEFGKGGEHIYAMHDLVAHLASRNLPGPADEERHTNAAFERGEIRATPRA